MRTFGTQGRVYSSRHYVVPRTEEKKEFIKRVKEGRYIVLFAQLEAYLKLEGVTVGYYVVFDHRQEPEPRVETETIDDVTVRSYVIPVIQEPPSDAHHIIERK